MRIRQKRHGGFIQMSIAKMMKMKDEGKCPFCGKDMTNPSFRDVQSKKEFEISGLCQSCQDEYFREMR